MFSMLSMTHFENVDKKKYLNVIKFRSTFCHLNMSGQFKAIKRLKIRKTLEQLKPKCFLYTF